MIKLSELVTELHAVLMDIEGMYDYEIPSEVWNFVKVLDDEVLSQEEQAWDDTEPDVSEIQEWHDYDPEC